MIPTLFRMIISVLTNRNFIVIPKISEVRSTKTTICFNGLHLGTPVLIFRTLV